MSVGASNGASFALFWRSNAELFELIAVQTQEAVNADPVREAFAKFIAGSALKIQVG